MARQKPDNGRCQSIPWPFPDSYPANGFGPSGVDQSNSTFLSNNRHRRGQVEFSQSSGSATGCSTAARAKASLSAVHSSGPRQPGSMETNRGVPLEATNFSQSKG